MSRRAKFKVVDITNDLQANPGYAKDTEEYPHLVDHIDDENEMFVINVDTGDFWTASEFFFMYDVKEFTVTK